MELLTSSLLPLILGTTASILFITANYVNKRQTVITLQTLAIIILVIQFGPVLNIWGVALLNMLFIIRNTLYSIKPLTQYSDKISIISLFVFPTAYFFIEIQPRINNGLPLELFLIFPIIAAMLNTAAFMQKTVIGFKILFGSSFLAWVAFDILKQQWGNLIGDAFSVVAAIISIILLTSTRKADNK